MVRKVLQPRHCLSGQSGVSLIELVVTMVILGVLAGLIMPSVQIAGRRLKEVELRRNLRVIRAALDEFKKANDKAVDEKKKLVTLNESGYPKTLKVLVEGYDFGGVGTTTTSKKKFLRRIPPDPFNPPKPGEEPKWGIRSYTDEPDSRISNEEDVYDVFSLSEETAIDGTKYKDW